AAPNRVRHPKKSGGWRPGQWSFSLAARPHQPPVLSVLTIEGAAGRDDSALLFRRRLLLARRRALDAQQGCRLGAEALQLLVPRLVLVHPHAGLVVPLAGLFLLAQLPVGHGQEEPVGAITPVAELLRLLERRDRGPPVTRAVLCYAQRFPAVPLVPGNVEVSLAYFFDCFLGEFDRLGRIAKLLVRTGGVESAHRFKERETFRNSSPRA